MNYGYLLLLTCIVLLTISSSDGYKGMMVFTVGSWSHMSFFSGVIEALAHNGHQITIVTPFKSKINATVKEIVLDEDYTDVLFGNTFQMTGLHVMQSMIKYPPEICIKALTQPNVVEAIQEDYDYILLSFLYTDCFLPLIYEKQIPFIYLTPNIVAPPVSEKIGQPEFFSVTPNKMMGLTYPLSFFERVRSTIANIFTSQLFRILADENIERTCRESNLWSPDTPSVGVLQRRASLVLCNGIRALEAPPKSVPPSVIYTGGIHIKAAKPLPQDLEDWIAGSGNHGCILFSLGSAVKPEQMQERHLQIIVKVLGSLHQRVLWKWNAKPIEGLPSNILQKSWLPQSDILAHPKTKLLITHGGLFSLQEATYYGVPVVGMPLFGDQPGNVAEAEAENWGRKMLWDEITEQIFHKAIMEVLTDKSIRDTISYRSQLMKDWPTKPSEDVIFWIEYVIRHKGAKHMRSPLVDLPWYQLYNTDVWIFIIATLLIVIVSIGLLLRKCLKYVFKKCFKRKFD